MNYVYWRENVPFFAPLKTIFENVHIGKRHMEWKAQSMKSLASEQQNTCSNIGIFEQSTKLPASLVSTGESSPDES